MIWTWFLIDYCFAVFWIPTITIINRRREAVHVLCFWHDLLLSSALGGLFGAVLSIPLHNMLGAVAGSATVAAVAIFVIWWKRRRPGRVARALGGKALARLAALVESMRELGVRQPALGGAQ